MHIAIDDTYGPDTATGSRYVTNQRRTHVAVIFPDEEVEQYRTQIRGCLEEVGALASKDLREFHFSKIYNRASPWNELAEGTNLRLMEVFAFIYEQYHWPVEIQTIDDRTLQDHG